MMSTATAKIGRWFLVVAVLGLFHALEQLFFGFEQAFADVMKMFRPFQDLFDNPDKAILVVISILVILWTLSVYGMSRGKTGERMVAGGFGLLLLPEIHHVTSAVTLRSYYPGLISGTLMFLVGLILIRSAFKKSV